MDYVVAAMSIPLTAGALLVVVGVGRRLMDFL